MIHHEILILRQLLIHAMYDHDCVCEEFFDSFLSRIRHNFQLKCCRFFIERTAS